MCKFEYIRLRLNIFLYLCKLKKIFNSMFYKLVEKKRNEWLSSPDCTVTDVIHYIEQKGKMRDAQIDAIKTFLYLKIVCGNQSLKQLFSQGFFNTMDIREEPLADVARNKLLADKADNSHDSFKLSNAEIFDNFFENSSYCK